MTGTEIAVLEYFRDLSYNELPRRRAWTTLIKTLDGWIPWHYYPERITQVAATEPALVRARLTGLLRDGGWPDEAESVRPVDRRTVRRAMDGLK